MRQRRDLVPIALVLLGLSLSLAEPASALPMWARRYNVSCTTCHAWPSEQLTATGLDFLRRGHRFKGDGFDKDVVHLLSAHVEWEYDAAQGTPTTFNDPEVHVHGGGALSSLFSGYFDANINNDIEAAYLQFTREYGDDVYFTARGGKLNPTLIRNYAGGLAVSASVPLVFDQTTLGANPFTPHAARDGVDVGGRWKALFVQAGVANGQDVPGQATIGNHKDFYATAEVAARDGVSGLGLYYDRGGYDLGDPSVAPQLSDRFDRTAVFANLTRDRFRLAAAYLVGKDVVDTVPDRKLHGYYALAELRPGGWWVPFLRYDEAKTELETGTDRVRQVTLGIAAQLYITDSTSARVVIEGSRSTDSDTGAKTNSGLLNLVWAF